MTPQEQKVMELALEALEFVNQTGDTQTFDMCYADKAITAIKAALAQPEQGWTPERIAGMKRLKDAQDKKLEQPEQEFVDYRAMYLKVRDELAELQQRTWVGLTDEEIWTVLQFRGYNTDTIEIAKAIEAKLKEKNNG